MVDESGNGVVSYKYDDYDTWNLYAYCGGNPINYVNPSGHKVINIIGKYVAKWLAKNILKTSAYIGAELCLRKNKGWKYSADFLKHSIQNNPSDLIFDRFSGDITCKLVDMYNFKPEAKYLSITMFANNYAWYLQVKRASHKYKITVNMKFKDRKQKII